MICGGCVNCVLLVFLHTYNITLSIPILINVVFISHYLFSFSNPSGPRKRRPHVLKIDVEGHDYEVSGRLLPVCVFLIVCVLPAKLWESVVSVHSVFCFHDGDM